MSKPRFTEDELRHARLAAAGTGRTVEEQAELARRMPGTGDAARGFTPATDTPVERTACAALSPAERQLARAGGLSAAQVLRARQRAEGAPGFLSPPPQTDIDAAISKLEKDIADLEKLRRPDDPAVQRLRDALAALKAAPADAGEGGDSEESKQDPKKMLRAPGTRVASSRGVRILERAGLVTLRRGGLGFDPAFIRELRGLEGRRAP